MAHSKTPGKAYEAIVHARQRLGIVHLALALIGSFSVWTGSPSLHFNPFSRGAGWIMIVLSALGWGPYLLSWLYSRSILDGKSRAVTVFSIGALLIAAAAAVLYQNFLAVQQPPSTILISAGVAVALLILAKLSALIFTSPMNSGD
jgi:hypothetical protein